MKPDQLKTAIGNEDIALLPNYSDIISRSEISLKTKLSRNIELEYPIILSPMKDISDVDSCVTMNKIGAAGILHRFMSLKERIEKAKKIKQESGKCYVAIGLNDSDNILDKFWMIADCFFMDTAHGTQQKVYDYIKNYNEHRVRFGDVDLITGNTLTYSSAEKHFELGSDGIRHGIGIGCFHPAMKILWRNFEKISNTGIKGREELKSISEINIGDYVCTHTGCFKKVINKTIREEKECLYNINGIFCTKEHMFYVVSKEFNNLGEFNKQLNRHLNCRWIQVKDLTKDYRLLNLIKGTYKLVDIETISYFSYKGEVYDLEVEEDHSYNIEGIVVHNSACTTWKNAGIGCPTLTANYYAWKGRKFWHNRTGRLDYPTILQDGGIKNGGDLVKAIASGCDAVIMGRLFAGCKETPGEILANPYGPDSKPQTDDGAIYLNEKRYSHYFNCPAFAENKYKMKKYRGMASKSIQEEIGKTKVFTEGDEYLVSYTGKSVVDIV